MVSFVFLLQPGLLVRGPSPTCPQSSKTREVLASACGHIATAEDHDPAWFERGSEMPGGRDVSDMSIRSKSG
jgi:hypothetical protein